MGVVVPRNRVILNYLQAHLRRCAIDTNTEEGSFAQFCMQVSRRVNHTSQGGREEGRVGGRKEGWEGGREEGRVGGRKGG